MRKGETVKRALLVETGVAVASVAIARRRPAAGAAVAALGALAAWGAFARNSPLYGRIRYRGPADADRFALTFDDGPGPSTPAVLDALRAADARATFFVLGRQVARYPELVRRMVHEGHEVANHGYDHGILVFRGPGHVRDQLRRTEAAVVSAAGPGAISATFRAPHGFRGPLTAHAARVAGYSTAGWTLGVFDSDQPGAEVIARRALAGLTPGAILLLHDADGWDPQTSRLQTAEAIAPICAGARARGLEPVPLRALTP